MDIHKPKPWHSWREFLKEYVIIVTGVLTALAGEQVVEKMTWQERAGSAEVAMRTELSDSLAAAYEITEMRSCINDRLTLLARALNSGDVETARRIVNNDKSFPPRRLWPDDAWRAAISTGVANHLRGDRLKTYSQLYDLVHIAGNAQNDSWRNVGELRAIDEAPLRGGFDASDPKARAIAALREELAVETQAAGYVTTIAKRRLGLALTSDQIAHGNGHLRNIAACRAPVPPPSKSLE